MNKKFRTLLALGVVTVSTAANIIPTNALSIKTNVLSVKKTTTCSTKGFAYMYFGGKVYKLEIGNLWESIIEPPTQEKPEVP